MMKKLFFRSCCTVITGLTTIAMVMPPMAMANRHITCGSSGYSYNYCRIYTGGRARIGHQISHKPCIEGDSWGYDSQGVWVDKGCRADFIVDEGYGRGRDDYYDRGYNSRHDYGSSHSHNNHDDNIGAALGIAAGAAILGALISGGTSSKNDSHTSSYNSHYNQRHSSNIPSWAIGTFQGRNPRFNREIELTIAPSGQVYAILDGHSVDGSFDGRVLHIKGAIFDVQRSNNGLTTTQQGNYRNQVHYYRYR